MALLEHQKNMVEDHLPLVKGLIMRTIDADESVQGLGYEDLFQAGCEALCHAALQYDPSRGASFGTYAKKVVLNQLISHCRKTICRQRHLKYLEELMEDGDGLTYADTLSDSNDQVYEDIDVLSMLEDAEKRYSGVCKKGIHALLLRCQGYTSTEIAASYGVNIKYVTAWISRAKNRLQADGSLACLM